MGKKLPPLPDEAFDGEKHRVELKQGIACQHEPKYVGSLAIECKRCGAGWTGRDVHLLYDLLKKQNLSTQST